jgi:penicillin-binding protein 1A
VVAPRQPGSSFKPVVYLVALENGRRPDEMVVDEPFGIGDYNPKNYNDKYYGALSLRAAFAKSVNSIPIRLTYEYGLDSVLKMANRLGVGTKLRREYSTVLGASEMTLIELSTIYAVIFNGGNSIIPYSIEYITDGNANIIYKRNPSAQIKLLQDNTVSEMDVLLREVVVSGTGRRANKSGRAIGGKTGTSNGGRDAWFVGNDGKLTIGVWVGNDNFTPTETTGGAIPADIFNDIVK